jgi:regulator of protease activity HflC (stomatin/prohibitin superfamily)
MLIVSQFFMLHPVPRPIALVVLGYAVSVLPECGRGVVFRLGRLLGGPKRPGLFLPIPVVDRMVKIDLRVVTLVIPPQEAITRHNVRHG